MSGHNKWSGIKHRKGAQDAKRANVFTKFGRLISIAAREGGGNPDSNVKLKFVVDQARKVNMPKDNIERAIKKGTGELKDGAEIEEALYEAYGPHNIAMLIKCATDNKNRVVGEIKTVLNKLGGKMVPSGSVSFSFNQVGVIDVVVEDGNLSRVELEAIEAGAEDTTYADNILTVYTKIEDLWTVKAELEKKNLEIDAASLMFVPTQKIEIDEAARQEYENLLEKLDELDDVQEIYDNL